MKATKVNSFRDLFEEWVDIDVALYYLAGILGVMELDTSHDAWVSVKGVFNTKNSISDSMFIIFEELRTLGVLEEGETGLVRLNSRRNDRIRA